jgi:hypothetical protein
LFLIGQDMFLVMGSGTWLSEISESNSYPLKRKCGYPNTRPFANVDTEIDVSEFVFTIFSI